MTDPTPLRSIAPAADPDVVEVLTALLAEAQAGVIASFAFAAVRATSRETMTSTVVAGEDDVIRLLGSVEYLKHRLMRRLDGDW